MSIFSVVYLITIPCALALFCNLSGCRTNMYQHVEAKHVPTSGKESAVVHVVYIYETNKYWLLEHTGSSHISLFLMTDIYQLWLNFCNLSALQSQHVPACRSKTYPHIRKGVGWFQNDFQLLIDTHALKWLCHNIFLNFFMKCHLAPWYTWRSRF